MNWYSAMAVYGLLLIATRRMRVVVHVAGLPVSLPVQGLLAAALVLAIVAALLMLARSLRGFPLFRPVVIR